MEKYFVFKQSKRAERKNKIVYWVFQKGKILPVAIIEERPMFISVSIFRGDKNIFYNIKEAYEKFLNADNMHL